MSSQMGNAAAGCCATPAPQLKLYQAFIFATPALFTFVLLLLILLILIRRRRRMRATSHARSQFFPRGLFSAQPSDRGLSKSIRDALPIVIYSEGCAISKVDNQCAVCLGDYQKNDKLQQLPVCGHVFHKDCVDEWLANHSTCPICRSVPIPSGKVVPMESPAQRVLPALGSTRLLPVLHAPRSTSASEPGLEGSCTLQSDLVRGCGESSSNSNVRASDGQDPQKVTGSTLVEHSIQIQT
ncbi:hypothetical protein CY35_13G090300 [Sphagnum magellanicum]|nr:hypothetical protein CY35_13G090300 [Sphagnum magellanicum]